MLITRIRKVIKRKISATHTPVTPTPPPPKLFRWVVKPAHFLRRVGFNISFAFGEFPEGSGKVLLALIALVVSVTGQVGEVLDFITEFAATVKG